MVRFSCKKITVCTINFNELYKLFYIVWHLDLYQNTLCVYLTFGRDKMYESIFEDLSIMNITGSQFVLDLRYTSTVINTLTAVWEMRDDVDEVNV